MNKKLRIILNLLIALSALYVNANAKISDIYTIDISSIITYFTFMLGFVFTAYIAMSDKKQIIQLKKDNNFKPIERHFNQVVNINLVGLMLSILKLQLNSKIIYSLLITVLYLSIFNSFLLIRDTFVVMSKE